MSCDPAKAMGPTLLEANKSKIAEDMRHLANTTFLPPRALVIAPDHMLNKRTTFDVTDIDVPMDGTGRYRCAEGAAVREHRPGLS